MLLLPSPPEIALTARAVAVQQGLQVEVKESGLRRPDDAHFEVVVITSTGERFELRPKAMPSGTQAFARCLVPNACDYADIVITDPDHDVEIHLTKRH